MARYLTDAVIATDEQRIYDAARSFGAVVKMTRSDHVSGTDRVAEIASTGDAEIIVNIQGDEPLIDPSAIDMGTPKGRSRPARIGRTQKQENHASGRPFPFVARHPSLLQNASQQGWSDLA